MLSRKLRNGRFASQIDLANKFLAKRGKAFSPYDPRLAFTLFCLSRGAADGVCTSEEMIAKGG